MPNQKLTIALLVASLILNVALAVFMGMDSGNTRRVVDTVLLETSEQSLRMESDLLADLDSKDPIRIDAARAKLRARIAIQSGNSYRIRTAPKAHPGKRDQ